VDGELYRLRGDVFGSPSFDRKAIPLRGVRTLTPVAPSKIIAIGLNYADHAAESKMPIPKEPVVFTKAVTCLQGPNDPVMLPRGSEKSDWEVELGVVIGSRARYVTEQEAMAHVAGFCVVNDLSERAFQLERSGQWVKGKSCDTFAPLGPWLVTRDDVPDPHALKMTLDVNGKRYQDGSTATMVYKVPFLVSYLSEFMTLEPGDVISTGTPPGVGLGQKPPVFLKAGDTMTLGGSGLGAQSQKVVQYVDSLGAVWGRSEYPLAR